MTPLTQPTPLRTSAVWSKYQTLQTLPHVYGQVNVRPIPFDTAGRRWLLADHSISGIDAVLVDDQPYAARELLNMTDETGHPVAVLELYDAVDSAERITVQMRGKVGSTGALITNPAYVMLDVLQLHGFAYTASDVSEFYRACELDGLTVASVLNGQYATGRAAIDAICMQVGAVWSLGLPGVARLWKPDALPDDITVAFAIGPDQIAIDARADADALRTKMVVRYDYDHATGVARRSMSLESSAAVESYGEINEEISADWLADQRVLENVYKRRLQYQSRPVWRVGIDIDERIMDLRYGDYVSVDHPLCPLSGVLPVVDAQINPDSAVGRVVIEGAVGAAQTITVTGQSVAVDSAQIRIQQINQPGVLSIVATDNQGVALPGAIVSIAGFMHVADADGAAKFTGVSAGLYTLQIVSGDETYTFENFEVFD